FQLIARSQQVSGTNLVVALRLRLIRLGRRAILAGSTYDLEENCHGDRDNIRDNPQSNLAPNHMRVGQTSKAEPRVPLPVRWDRCTGIALHFHDGQSSFVATDMVVCAL